MQRLKPLVSSVPCATVALYGLALLLASAANPAAAQPIYRCANQYSQTPCANGHTIDSDDPRSEAQRQAAEQGLARDKALAHSMEAARQRDEAMALRAQQTAQLAAQQAMQRQRHTPQAIQETGQDHKKKAKARAAKPRKAQVPAQETGVFTAQSAPQTPGLGGAAGANGARHTARKTKQKPKATAEDSAP